MKTDPNTLERVKQAVQKATVGARAAGDEFLKTARINSDGLVVDACGFADVRTYQSNTAVTRALKELGIIGNKTFGYYAVNIDLGFGGQQSINLKEATAKAAAKILTEELGQEFYMHSNLD